MFFPLLFLAACSDYNLAPEVTEEADTSQDIDDNSCQQDHSAYVDVEISSLGENAWSVGWNTVAAFTLSTDKDTCFDQTFEIEFTATDVTETDWNNCENYVDQDRLRIFRNVGDTSLLQELDADWEFQGATGSNGSYVHTCDPGRFIVYAMPTFAGEETSLLPDEPVTFVIMMEADGSTDPEDRMMISLHWDDSGYVHRNTGNGHGREGALLPFTNSNE